MFCERCGKRVLSDEQYCVYCENAIKEEQEREAERKKKLKEKLVFGIITVFVVLVGVLFSINSSYQDVDSSASNMEHKNLNNNSNESTMKLELKTNFVQACNEIDINVSQIKNLEKQVDWIGGERYNFTYKGLAMKVYCNADIQ